MIKEAVETRGWILSSIKKELHRCRKWRLYLKSGLLHWKCSNSRETFIKPEHLMRKLHKLSWRNKIEFKERRLWSGEKKKIATQILRFDMTTMKTGHGPTWVRCLAPRAAHHSPWKSACWGQTAGGCGCGLDLPPGEITSQQKSKSFNASDWGWTQQTPGLKNQLRAS